jgi:ankyrin repeat protein
VSCRKGHKAVVKLLLEKGADVESQDRYYGHTPLSWAVRNGHKAIMKLLLEKRADVESRTDGMAERRSRGLQRRDIKRL